MYDASIGSFIYTSVILFGAYTLFGMTGFGQNIIAMPLLALVSPLKFSVPLISLLDVVFVAWSATKFWRQANYKELIALLPFLAVGMLLGAAILLIAPERILLLSLGAIIITYGVYCIIRRNHSLKMSKILAPPIGFFAGALSAAFGTGGPLYVMYLSGRILDKSELRASIVSLLVLSTSLRIGILGAGGLYSNQTIWLWWLLVLPSCFAGVKLGHYLHHRIKSSNLLFFIHLILIASGTLLIAKNI